jgi:hypothetical protein
VDNLKTLTSKQFLKLCGRKDGYYNPIEEKIRNINIAYAYVSELNLKNFNFSNAKFTRVHFHDTDFFECDFHNVILDNCIFTKCDMRWSSFNTCSINTCNFIECNLAHCDFNHSVIRDTNLAGQDFSFSSFFRAGLYNVNLCNSRLPSPQAFMMMEIRKFGMNEISNELCLELMRYDAASIENGVELMNDWAFNGPCPFSNSKWARAAMFSERIAVWKPGPSLPVYKLAEMVYQEICPDWTEEKYESFKNNNFSWCTTADRKVGA